MYDIILYYLFTNYRQLVCKVLNDADKKSRENNVEEQFYECGNNDGSLCIIR